VRAIQANSGQGHIWSARPIAMKKMICLVALGIGYSCLSGKYAKVCSRTRTLVVGLLRPLPQPFPTGCETGALPVLTVPHLSSPNSHQTRPARTNRLFRVSHLAPSHRRRRCYWLARVRQRCPIFGRTATQLWGKDSGLGSVEGYIYSPPGIIESNDRKSS
jgi:hypothetical protein